MSCPCLSAKRRVLPIQVWVHLATDCQMRVIRLMAQLAFKLVAEQSTSELTIMMSSPYQLIGE